MMAPVSNQSIVSIMMMMEQLNMAVNTIDITKPTVVNHCERVGMPFFFYLIFLVQNEFIVLSFFFQLLIRHCQIKQQSRMMHL
jgi:hypothetical protein